MELHGLVSSAALNGRRGCVLAPSAAQRAGGRVPVLLAGSAGGHILVARPQNLRASLVSFAGPPAASGLGRLWRLYTVLQGLDCVVALLSATDAVRLEASRSARVAVWEAAARGAAPFERAWHALRNHFPFQPEEDCLGYDLDDPPPEGFTFTSPRESRVATPGEALPLDVRWTKRAGPLTRRASVPAWRWVFRHAMHGLSHAVRQVRGHMPDSVVHDFNGLFQQSPRGALACRVVTRAYAAQALFDDNSGYYDIGTLVEGGWAAFQIPGSSMNSAMYEMLQDSGHDIGSVAFCEKLLAPPRFGRPFNELLGRPAVAALSATRGADVDLPRGWRAVASGPLSGSSRRSRR